MGNQLIDNKTIFIAIPSIEDTELVPTILNALQSAENSNRISIGVAYATEFKNKKLNEVLINAFKDFNNISFNFINVNKYYGAGWGRINSSKLYNDEDYYLQIDSHMLFDSNWDTKLINIFEDAKINVNKKFVLSGYPSAYHYNINKQRKNINNDWRIFCSKYVDGTLSDRYESISEYTLSLPNWIDVDPQDYWNNTDKKFFPSPKVSGGFTFGDRDFGRNYAKYYPYAPLFYDEEIIQSIELINDGYEIICPSIDIPIAHLYSVNINENGGERKFTTIGHERSNLFITNYKKYLLSNKEKIEFYKQKTGFDLLKNKVEFNMPEPDWFKNVT
jgi:hypothetical protein